MRGLVEAGRDRLAAGASALDVVVQTIAALEESGLYVAGRGASANAQGDYELDAGLMDETGAGAVAALQGFCNPILVAQAVMRLTPHVMLAGEGAAAFARSHGLAEIADPTAWFTPAGVDESNHAPGAALGHGTVGCVVRDGAGRLAAGTSTGGVFGKLAGRVGDTPALGAGVWADATAAVSCTGQGEYFLRTAAAAQVAWRMREPGSTLADATARALGEVAALGGEGGLIAVAADGTVCTPFVSEGMKRAALHMDGRIEAEAF